MRRLILNSPNGDYVNGLESNRNFYFFELEHLIDLAQDQSKDVNRQFVVFFDGEKIVDDVFHLSNGLQDSMKKCMKQGNAESVQYLHKVQKEVDFDRPFREFLIKYDEKLSISGTKPFPFFLGIYQSKDLFSSIHEKTGDHFYLKLNKATEVIRDLFLYLIKEMELNKGSFYDFIKKEDNFNRVCNYIPAKMDSIDESRIETVYPAMKKYQILQDTLFKDLPFYLPFNKCMNMQKELIDDMYNEYHKHIFKGRKIVSSEELEQNVLLSVINDYFDTATVTLEQLRA